MALAKKRRIHGIARDLAADTISGHGGIDVSATMDTTCAVYYHIVRNALQAVNTLELIFDASRFATRDTEMTQVFAFEGVLPVQAIRHPRLTAHGRPTSYGFAANLPPARHRELRWREGVAGSKPSKEEKERYRVSGFQANRGMATHDLIQMLNCLLGHAGKCLISYQCPLLPRLAAEEERVWCKEKLRWLRRKVALTERQLHHWEPEVPNEIFLQEWNKIPMLLLTLDQASTGWGACHFLCAPGSAGITAHGIRKDSKRRKQVLKKISGGMNLLLDFIADPFHRSWNDWKQAIKHAIGHITSSIVQMTVVYNHNYQPYLNGANLVKKEEFLKEFQVFNAQHGADWQEVLSELATDGVTAHGAHSEGEAQRLYEALVLQNQHFVKKGTYAKQSAWYSIVEAIAHHDKLFIPWRYLLTQVARDLLRQGTKLSELQEKAVKTLKEVADLPHAGLDDQQTKEHHKKAMQEMKKKAGAGQQIVLCPLLMHNWNWFNMRLVLLFGQYMWSEQTLLSTEKQHLSSTSPMYCPYRPVTARICCACCGMEEHVMLKSGLDLG